VWTNVLAGVVLSDSGFSWPYSIALVLSMSLFYAGGMCLNDIGDVQVDSVKRPSRPIPSGRVSLGEARLLTAILFSGALSLLLIMPHREAAFAGLLLLAVILVYDRYHKAHWLSVFLMAACRLLIFVVAGLAVAGRVSDTVLGIGFIQFGYVLIISLTARFENSAGARFKAPIIPAMLAGISLIDGVYLAIMKSPSWLAVGVLGCALTHFGQRYVRGD